MGLRMKIYGRQVAGIVIVVCNLFRQLEIGFLFVIYTVSKKAIVLK
jgi:hypothetical protein